LLKQSLGLLLSQLSLFGNLVDSWLKGLAFLFELLLQPLWNTCLFFVQRNLVALLLHPHIVLLRRYQPVAAELDIGFFEVFVWSRTSSCPSIK